MFRHKAFGSFNALTTPIIRRGYGDRMPRFCVRLNVLNARVDILMKISSCSSSTSGCGSWTTKTNFSNCGPDTCIGRMVVITVFFINFLPILSYLSESIPKWYALCIDVSYPRNICSLQVPKNETLKFKGCLEIHRTTAGGMCTRKYSRNCTVLHHFQFRTAILEFVYSILHFPSSRT